MATVDAFFQAHPTTWEVLKLIFTVAATTAVVTLLLRLERKASKRMTQMRNNINLRYVESAVRFIVIFLAVQWVIMSSPLTQSFGRVLFQGTTVIAAIAGFAAQPVIADMICGLMISVTKPFNIGDRIELEDGSAGIVKDITLRHVTLQDIDTVVRVIPNSKLNGMKITNMSYQMRVRSVHMRFGVAYDTDPKQAMAVIGHAVEESPYSIPGKPGKDGAGYGPVYFIQYADSSLVMATTVYYEPTTPTEVVKSDINTRVKQALDDNGIEIPYNYVNVVMNGPKE
ncbi:MAG: mechanosensitive ion channel family protein [Clostridia bacterium]|nr:mechanosensitive ion channel family protein [Clostridia bacterium]